MSVAFEPIQSGTGDPSPTNVRPISGRTEVNVGRTGKNLFDGVYPDIVANLVKYRSIAVGDGTFTISTDCPQNSAQGANIFFLAGNVETGASTLGNGVWSGQTQTVTAVDGYVTVAYRSEGGVDPTNYHTQIECGSTATAYEPYTPVTLTISLGQTVYGGTLNVKTGVVTITDVKHTVNVNSVGQNATYTDVYFYTLPAEMRTDGIMLSNMFKGISPTSAQGIHDTTGDCLVAKYSNLTGCNFKITSITTITDFREYFTEHPIDIVGKLATPTTIQLTPAQLMMLKGYNSITGDGVITITAYVKTTT